MKKTIIFLLLIPLVFANQQFDLMNTDLPFEENITINFNGLQPNITYELYHGDFLENVNNISNITMLNNSINFSLFIPEDYTPGIYNTYIKLMYNQTLVSLTNYTINITFNLSIYNIFDNSTIFIAKDIDYYFYQVYDKELPKTIYEDTFRIEAPENTTVFVTCDKYLVCNQNNFTIPINKTYYDYYIKWHIPFGANLGTYKSNATFTLMNGKSGSIIFESKILETPIKVIEIEKPTNKSIDELSVEELNFLLESLENSANIALKKLEEANKTKIVNQTVEKEKPVPVVVNDEFLEKWYEFENYHSELDDKKDELIKTQREQIREQEKQIKLLIEQMKNETQKRIQEQNDYFAKLEYEKKLNEKRRKRNLYIGIFLLINIIIFGWYKSGEVI